MESSCGLCGGACVGANLAPLTDPALLWLWRQITVVADRRGDPDLTSGNGVLLRAPDDPAGRAAAVGLLGGAVSAGQRRTISLTTLTERIRRHGPNLTPGAVAAHAVERPLAVRARDRRAALRQERRLFDRLHPRLASLTGPFASDPTGIANTFLKTRTGRSLLGTNDAEQVIDAAVRVLRALPADGERIDRRLLAAETLADPHGLDDSQPISSAVRALLTAGGAAPTGARARDVWSAAGVNGDEFTGGLGALGLHPVGWTLPSAAVVTLPPVELVDCRWPAPDESGSWAFVTENPSILTAARLLVTPTTKIRLLCTSGTPSAVETAAIGRLTDAGWQVAVRADFDEAGLKHVAALLAAGPHGVPWRMTAADYLAAVGPDSDLRLRRPDLCSSPWDPALTNAMRLTGTPVFEEALLPVLLDDLRLDRPG